VSDTANFVPRPTGGCCHLANFVTSQHARPKSPKNKASHREEHNIVRMLRTLGSTDTISVLSGKQQPNANNTIRVSSVLQYWDGRNENVQRLVTNWLLTVDTCLHYVCWTWRLLSIPLTTIYLLFVSSDSSVYAVSYFSGFDRICLTDLIKSSTATIRHQQFT